MHPPRFPGAQIQMSKELETRHAHYIWYMPYSANKYTKNDIDAKINYAKQDMTKKTLYLKLCQELCTLSTFPRD